MTERTPSGTDIPGPAWFKSSYSGGEGNECVDVADLYQRVAVRDSKDPSGPVLDFPAAAFAAFVAGVRPIG
ncbi:DUF397 domain-containing protein [Streptomyces sp. NPDC048650]|uniref:DUF397 domain-containing protein n=1 Tax=Streptomyces sp. NPDC048650 TaxID=3365583 RepID=UPI003710967B